MTQTEATIDVAEWEGRIWQGDCLEFMRGLPEQSVNCCVTSPPYWGLRDYGTEPLVWGGDAGCEHEWGEERSITTGRNDGDRARLDTGTYDGGGPDVYYVGKQTTSQGSFCPLCGAWRGNLGLEPTPELYIEHMVEVFRGVRRVLRDDGTCWLNIGDSYASGAMVDNRESAVYGDAGPGFRTGLTYQAQSRQKTAVSGLKPKDLCMIPARLALALQADGWWVRSDIIWAKPNPMPESCTDRPTSSHEHVFLLTKSGSPSFWTHRDQAGTRSQPEPDYRWLDGAQGGKEQREEPPGDWRREKLADGSKRWKRINLWRGHDYWYDADAVREAARVGYRGTDFIPKSAKDLAARSPTSATAASSNNRTSGFVEGRNLRNVWTIATEPFPGAHFATYPTKLVAPCIKAGCPHKVCSECGSPWVRDVQRGPQPVEPAHRNPPKRLPPGIAGNVGAGNMGFRASRLSGQEMARWRAEHPDRTLGFKPTCSCTATPSGDPQDFDHLRDENKHTRPGLVLDPFAGSGTTGVVAIRHGRRFVGAEINPEYAAMAQERIDREREKLQLPFEEE